jgi:hypothetical protein
VSEVVGVLVGVEVWVAVGEGPVVGVRVWVGVFVCVAVLVGVGDGPVGKVTTSCGGEPPSRELKTAPSVLSGRRAKL